MSVFTRLEMKVLVDFFNLALEVGRLIEHARVVIEAPDDCCAHIEAGMCGGCQQRLLALLVRIEPMHSRLATMVSEGEAVSSRLVGEFRAIMVTEKIPTDKDKLPQKPTWLAA